MDYRQLFSDPKLQQEFLDKFPDLVAGLSRGGLENTRDAAPDRDAAARAVKEMGEGRWSPGGGAGGGFESIGGPGGLEAIIQRFTRPVLLVQNGTFRDPPDSFPNSEEIKQRLRGAQQVLDAAIPRVARIDLRNHHHKWVGTGWMVAPGTVVTNRHVAVEFATESGGFDFRTNAWNRSRVSPSVDFWHEYANGKESVFRVRNVLWIEPDSSFDVALLQVDTKNLDDETLPAKIDLMSQEELNKIDVGSWLAVIGYPAHDSRNDRADQQRIFDGVYNVKRLAPGQFTALQSTGHGTHDATTLGGNSGSVVIDLATGKAAALHYGGAEGQANFAVLAPRVAAILKAHT